MGVARGLLIGGAILLIASGCSKTPSVKNANYELQMACSGGGGHHTCVVKNVGDNNIGPFELEVEFIDDRGNRIGRKLVRNDIGLEAKREWRFNLIGPTRTRSVRLRRVVPQS